MTYAPYINIQKSKKINKIKGFHKKYAPTSRNISPAAGTEVGVTYALLTNIQNSMKINKMKGIHKELGAQKLKHQPRCGHRSWGDLRTLHKHTKINKH